MLGGGAAAWGLGGVGGWADGGPDAGVGSPVGDAGAVAFSRGRGRATLLFADGAARFRARTLSVDVPITLSFRNTTVVQQNTVGDPSHTQPLKM